MDTSSVQNVGRDTPFGRKNVNNLTRSESMDSEVEIVAKMLLKASCRDDEWENLVDGLKDSYLKLARWHIREKEIAVLEARLEEHTCEQCEMGKKYHGMGRPICNRVLSMKSKLAELKGRKDDGEK